MSVKNLSERISVMNRIVAIAGMSAMVLATGSMTVLAQCGEPPSMPPRDAPGGPTALTQEVRVFPPPSPPDMWPCGECLETMMDGLCEMPQGHPVVPHPDALKRAGASEQQIKALPELAFELHLKLIDLEAASEKAEMMMERLIRASTIDEKAIMQEVEALNQARSATLRAEVESRIKVKQLLGEDILKQLREQWRQVRPGMGSIEDWPEGSPRRAGPRPMPERRR